jgi:type II secretory pathway pseudopilin PulG
MGLLDALSGIGTGAKAGLLALIDNGSDNALGGIAGTMPTDPVSRNAIRSQFLMSLGQGIQAGSPAAGVQLFQQQMAQQAANRLALQQAAMQQQVMRQYSAAQQALDQSGLQGADLLKARIGLAVRFGDTTGAEKYSEAYAKLYPQDKVKQIVEGLGPDNKPTQKILTEQGELKDTGFAPIPKIDFVNAGDRIIPADKNTGQMVAGGAPITIGISPDKQAETDNKTPSEWETFRTAYLQKLGKDKWADLTPDEQMAALPAFAAQRQDQDVRASLLASRALSESLRRMQEAQIPTKEEAEQVARDLINKRISPSQLSSLIGGFGQNAMAFKRMIYLAASKLDPQFDFEAAESDYQFAKSPAFQTTIRYMDGIANTLDRVQSTADALANTSVKSINSLLNAGRSEFNNVDLKKFVVDRLWVADEIGKLLAGGGTGAVTSDSKLAQAQKIIHDSDSPAAIAAAMSEVRELINRRRSSLVRGTYLEREQQKAGGAPAAGSAPKIRTWNPRTGRFE